MLTLKFLWERRLGSLTACKQRNTIIKGLNNCDINRLLCNTVIVTKIQRFASERSWSSQQSLNIPMKSDVGTKISQVFLQVTHVSAHGNLAQAKDTDCVDQKGPRGPISMGGSACSWGRRFTLLWGHIACWVACAPVMFTDPRARGQH